MPFQFGARQFGSGNFGADPTDAAGTITLGLNFNGSQGSALRNMTGTLNISLSLFGQTYLQLGSGAANIKLTGAATPLVTYAASGVIKINITPAAQAIAGKFWVPQTLPSVTWADVTIGEQP